MIRGLPASLALHAAVLGAGYLAWPYVGTSVMEDEFVIVPVELVDVGEMTNVAPVTEPPEQEIEPEEEPEPTPPEPEEDSDDPVEEEPDTRDIPEDDVATSSESAPPEPDVEDVMPDLDREPEEEEDEPEPEEEPELPEPTSPNPRQDESADLDNFLDSVEETFQSERNTKRAAQPPERDEERLLNETPPAQEPRRGAGDRSANTVRIEQLLYNQIFPCWDGVADQPEPERLNVSMRAELDAEGNLVDVELVRPSRPPIGDRSMSLAIERALRAVRKCQPYRLPRDDYDLWKTANINLGPAFSED